MEEKYEDYVFERESRAPKLHCDFCSSHISPHRKVNFYVTNVDFSYTANPVREEASLMRFYCPDCDRDRILFPTTMGDEYLLEAEWMPRSNGDIKLWDVETVDESPEGDGIPWDPCDAATEIMGFDFQQFMFETQAHGFGPEDIVDQLRFIEVDIWEHVDFEGNVDAPDLSPEEFAGRALSNKMMAQMNRLQR